MITGAVVSPTPPAIDIQRLVNSGAHYMRWQLTFLGEVEYDTPEHYRATIDERLALMDSILAVVSNIKVILCIFTPPGGYDGTVSAMFTSKAPWGRQCFIDTWKYIAARYKNEPRVCVYDLLNEPRGSYPQVNTLMADTIKEIKKIDSKKYVSVETVNGNPGKFNYMPVFNTKRIYYQTHMYAPMSFTHQGVYPQYPAGKKYPSGTNTKQKLINTLSRAREFQLKNKAQIYIGEFAASIYTDPDSRYNYYKDCLDIFRSYNWHWTFHSWGESHVWSVEQDPKIMALLKSRY